MREDREFSHTDHGMTFKAMAYTEDGGQTWRWASNGNYCPLDACVSHSIPCDTVLQGAAIEKQSAEQIAEYIKARSNRQPSAEEQYEMRAAFGPGRTVQDIFTGQEFHT